MNDDDAVQAIELFARASVEVTSRALAEAAPGIDLSLLQWRALRIVGDDPAGARVGQVGDGVGVPLPAASRLVQRLQQRGLVHVQRDPDDGRALRVRLTHAGSHARSTVLARRRSLISEALDQTVLPAEAVNGLRVVGERFAQLSREIPAPRTGPTWSPERGTMNESDTHETIKTGTFAAGEETTPEKDAEDRILHRGSFAAGEETTPEKDAEQRIHGGGGFGVGQEEKPQEDAEKRSHPGTFGDTEPTA
jgi:DNA-binding MarR family transcriptional regulator